MIAITGATGGLGRLVIDDLLGRGVPASDVVAIARSAEKATPLADLGVQVRIADYDDAAGWPAALDGVDRLLLVSGNEIGKREAQHRTVIDAAVAAGVGEIVYTSLTKADTSRLSLAAEHLATEQHLASVDVPATVLRNDWYFENYTGNLDTTLATGTILSATEGASFNPAARADYAAAAATVLTTDTHTGQTLELAGTPLTVQDLAATITEVTGTEVGVTEVTPEAYEQILTDAGLPGPVATMLRTAEEGIAAGDLSEDPSTLEALVGRPLTPLADVVRAATA
jgi:NAD(P)H dehydrogenase (quinone)